MNIEVINSLISSLGFPIVCVIGLGYFITRIWGQYRDDMNANMERLQTRCLEREARMGEQLEKSEGVIEKAIETLAFYENNISDIKADVADIKNIILQNNSN